MKKTLTIFTLIAAMILSCAALTACGGSSEMDEPAGPDFVGEWDAKIDVASAMKNAIAEMGIGNSKVGEIVVTVSLSFKEDGTYNFIMDSDEYSAKAKEYMTPIFEKYMKKLASVSDLSVDSLISAWGFASLDELVDAKLEEMAAISIFDEGTEESGKYEVDGDKLYTIADGKEKDENNYVKFTSNEYVFKIVEVADSNNSGEGLSFLKDVLPVTFTRK